MQIRFLYLFLLCSLLTGCSTQIFDIEENTSSDKHFLKLKTVSSEGELSYPMQVYAYDTGGNVVSELILDSPSEDISMELSSGNYTIAAVSGTLDFSKGYVDKPLMLANNNVSITTKDAKTTLTMNYAVAKLGIAVSDVPSDITKVTISINSFYNKVTPLGECDGNMKIDNIQCNYDSDNGLWKTDTIYVLPSIGENVVFTIRLYTDDSLNKEFTYEYNGNLQAGTPYFFTGSYNSGIVNAKLTLELKSSVWNDPITHDFTFGEGANKEDNNDVTPTDVSVFNVAAMPEPCSVWIDSNGEKHIIASIDEEGNALLFSKKEWGPIASVDIVLSEISTYSEGSIGGWIIPSEEIVIKLCSLYKINGTIGTSKLSQLLVSNDFDNIHFEKTDDKEAYLYSEQNKEFTFTLGNPRKTKASSHYLRLVKPVKFIVP